MLPLQQYLAFIFTSGLLCYLFCKWLVSHWHSIDIECMLKHLSKVIGTSKMVLKILTSDFSKMGIRSLMSMTCICTSQIVWNTAWKEDKQHHSNPSAENNFPPKGFTGSKSECCQIIRSKQSPTVVRSTYLQCLIVSENLTLYLTIHLPNFSSLFHFVPLTFFNHIPLPGW